MPLRLIPHLHRLVHRIALDLARSDEFQASQPEAHVLAFLASSGDSTIADVQRAFAHKKSTLTSVLDRLVERGYVTRTTSESDRRTFDVRLTAEGRRVAVRVYRHFEALEKRLLRHAGKGDLEALQRIALAAEALDAPPAARKA